MVIADSNPMYHVLMCQVLGGKYSKWIIILQEFDLDFTKSKVKKSLVFSKLIFDLDEETELSDSLLYDSLFLSHCSLSIHTTHGMEIFSFTFKPNAFSQTSLAKSADAYATTLAVTSSSATLYIAVALTPFFGDV